MQRESCECPDQRPRVTWLRLAAHPGTVRRASFTAVIVGSVLVGINHGPALLAGDFTRGRLVQMVMTYFVPYIVSTVSSVSTRRELSAKSASTGERQAL